MVRRAFSGPHRGHPLLAALGLLVLQMLAGASTSEDAVSPSDTPAIGQGEPAMTGDVDPELLRSAALDMVWLGPRPSRDPALQPLELLG
jgi:hypothetical protein